MNHHKLSALPLAAAILIIAAALGACNAAKEELEPTQYTNTAVTSFALVDDDDVLANLSTVFFSIDLINAQIFNADSLPKGTVVKALQLTIGTGALSKVELAFTDTLGRDTVVNYLSDNSVKVNFTAGPVRLDVTSYDGTTSRSYEVKVNVHREDADLLVWRSAEGGSLPTSLPSVSEAQTAQWRGRPAVLTTDGSGNACLAACTDVQRSVWTLTDATLPAGADVATFAADETSLYITAAGSLHTSADGGASWADTGAPMHYIYGLYEGTVLGAVQGADGVWRHSSHPGAVGAAVDPAMPVGETSQLLVCTGEWMESPIGYLAGGILADGTLTGSTWGYDGSAWACISADGLPARRGMTLVPYYVFRTSSSSWTVTRQSAFLALGGMDAAGATTRTVHKTTDYGLHWLEAGDALQLPAGLPAFSGARAFVYSTMMDSDSSAGSEPSITTRWSPLETPRPALWVSANTTSATQETGVTPITEWETPWIYLFGGRLADGTVNDIVIRGVINRLKYKPLQ